MPQTGSKMELWPLFWRDEVIFNSSLPLVTGGGSAHREKKQDVFLCVRRQWKEFQQNLNHLGPDRTRQQPAGVIYIQPACTLSGSI